MQRKEAASTGVKRILHTLPRSTELPAPQCVLRCLRNGGGELG